MRLALINSGVVVNVVESDHIPGDGFGVDLVIESDVAGVGDTYSTDDAKFTAAVAPATDVTPIVGWSDAGLDARYWQIDTGPFKDRFDRFGYVGLKYNLLALGRTNDMAYAAFADLNGRAFVDIKARRAELAGMLAAFSSILVALSKPPITPAMISAICDSQTTDYERHTKGLVQPV